MKKKKKNKKDKAKIQRVNRVNKCGGQIEKKRRSFKIKERIELGRWVSRWVGRCHIVQLLLPVQY